MKKKRTTFYFLALLMFPGTLRAAPLAKITGADLKGGAAATFGASQYGRQPVNYIYAKPNRAAAAMSARKRRPAFHSAWPIRYACSA